MKVEGSRCLRVEQTSDYGERKVVSGNAKSECSKNRRCVGIEIVPHDGIFLFRLCLDSIYRSTALDKYEESKNRVLKKAESQCKFTTHESLQPTITCIFSI